MYFGRRSDPLFIGCVFQLGLDHDAFGKPQLGANDDAFGERE